MEKRLLVAIFLSFLVLYAYQVFVQKPATEKARREAPAAADGWDPAAAGSTAATGVSAVSAPAARARRPPAGAAQAGSGRGAG